MPATKTGPAGLGTLGLFGLCASGTVLFLAASDLIIDGIRKKTIAKAIAETATP
jgi:hypothetical protein